MIRFNEAQRATIAAKLKPIRPNRSSDLSHCKQFYIPRTREHAHIKTKPYKWIMWLRREQFRVLGTYNILNRTNDVEISRWFGTFSTSSYLKSNAMVSFPYKEARNWKTPSPIKQEKRINLYLELEKIGVSELMWDWIFCEWVTMAEAKLQKWKPFFYLKRRTFIQKTEHKKKKNENLEISCRIWERNVQKSSFGLDLRHWQKKFWLMDQRFLKETTLEKIRIR